MLLRTAARRVAAARPSIRRTAPQALVTRQLAYQGLHEALEKKLGTQPTRLPQDAEDLPKSFDVGERAAELGVRLSQHELDNLYAELKKGRISASLHAIDARRLHLLMKWVVSFSILSLWKTSGPSRRVRENAVASMASLRSAAATASTRCLDAVFMLT